MQKDSRLRSARREEAIQKYKKWLLVSGCVVFFGFGSGASFVMMNQGMNSAVWPQEQLPEEPAELEHDITDNDKLQGIATPPQVASEVTDMQSNSDQGNRGNGTDERPARVSTPGDEKAFKAQATNVARRLQEINSLLERRTWESESAHVRNIRAAKSKIADAKSAIANLRTSDTNSNTEERQQLLKDTLQTYADHLEDAVDVYYEWTHSKSLRDYAEAKLLRLEVLELGDSLFNALGDLS